MEPTPQKPEMKDNILKAIKDGQVKMRPKWLFITQTAFLALGTILAGLTALFIASFIVFMLRQSGVWFLPDFGFENFGLFFTSLPWILLAAVLTFIILLEVLIKKYSFAYGRPYVYSALGVIAGIALGGIIIGYTSFHQNLFDRAQNGELPFGAPLYRHFMEPPDDITVGTITQITPDGYQIQGPDNKIFIITITPQTKLPMQNKFQVGDNIVIIGDRQNNLIQAEGIEKPNNLPPPHHVQNSPFPM